MYNLDENYYLRKQYFAENIVPTQTEMKRVMGERLAKVYFKDMHYNLKVLAGLEPRMKSGGSEWYMPPSDLKKGRSVLRPVEKACISRLQHTGLDALGEYLLKIQRDANELEKDTLLAENDRIWKEKIKVKCLEREHMTSQEEETNNLLKIREALRQFGVIYGKSLSDIESILCDSGKNAVERVREEAYTAMKKYHEIAVEKQATALYNEYDLLLNKTKEELKRKFMNNIDSSRIKTIGIVHDLKVEKHKAIEKLRNFLECKNLACQVYVAAKEKIECRLEIKQIEKVHGENMTDLNEAIKLTKHEIANAEKRQQKRLKLNKVWQKKVCHVVRKFQTFVAYCLKLIPEHSEFFINMEKLMLIQLDKSLEDSNSESILQEEGDISTRSLPREDEKQEPYIIFGDMKQKSTSTLTDVPVFMVNKHCIYAACENMKDLNTKLQDLYPEEVDSSDVKDTFDYSYSLPVKCTSQHKLRQLNLESSIMQIIQNEISNPQNIASECCICKIKHCFCSPLQYSDTNVSKGAGVSTVEKTEPTNEKVLESDSVLTGESASYSTPKSCTCHDLANKVLSMQLPPYMINTLPYSTIEIPNYVKCTENELRSMVKSETKTRARAAKIVEAKTKEISTQYSDEEFKAICNCYYNADFENICREIGELSAAYKDSKFDPLSDKASLTYLTRSPKTFAVERARELKDIIGSSQYLKEIFKKTDCKF